MSATGKDRRACGPDSGATLLEMLVVMGLLLMATGLIFPNLRRPYDTLSADTARAAVAADLRNARAKAIRTGSSVSFVVAADGRSYGYDDGRVLLPAAVRLVSEPDAILFAGDGSSTNARLAVLQGGRRLDLDIDGLSGVVSGQAHP